MRITSHTFQDGKPTGYALHLGWSDTKRWSQARGKSSYLTERPVVVVVQGDRLCDLIVDCTLIDTREPLMDDLRALVSYYLPSSYWHLWPNNSKAVQHDGV